MDLLQLVHAHTPNQKFVNYGGQGNADRREISPDALIAALGGSQADAVAILESARVLDSREVFHCWGGATGALVLSFTVDELRAALLPVLTGAKR